MTTIRRLYVYLISGVSLAVMIIGLINLGGIAIGTLWEALTDTNLLVSSGEEIRREVSLNLALVAVALPLWGLHWYLAERWARPDLTESDRTSPIRALFIAIVLSGTMLNLATALSTLTNATLSRIGGVSLWTSGYDIAMAIAVMVINSLVWGYYLSVRRRDTSFGPLAGAAVWLVRLYQYGAAFAGAIVLLFGLTQLLQVILSEIFLSDSVLDGGGLFGRDLINALTMIIVGVFVWGIHWGYSLHIVTVDDWRAESEAHAQLRKAYLYLGVFVSVAVTLVFIILSLNELLRLVLGVDTSGAADPLWVRLVGPLMQAIPFGLFWLYHQRVIWSESATSPVEETQQQRVERLYSYVVAFLALAFTAAGTAWLLGVMIEFVFDRAQILDTDPEWIPEQISRFLSIVLVGGVVWAWHWFSAQRRVFVEPANERRATSRRVYLYLVLTGATLAFLISLAITLYQALQVLLGVRDTTGLAADIGILLGIVIVAVFLIVYHLLALRTDMQYSDELIAESEEPLATSQTVYPVELSIPDSVDPEDLIANLQRYLPPGTTLAIDRFRPPVTRSTATSTNEKSDVSAPEDQLEDNVATKSEK